MSRALFFRRGLFWTAGILAAAVTLAVLLAAAVDAGFFRAPLIRFAARHAGRAIKVDGALTVHALALHPRVVAESVMIGNPAWTPPGTTAQIGRVSIVISLPWFHRSLGIDRLEMEAATLTLQRDGAGYANWQSTDPRVPDDTNLPMVRSLSIPDARVTLKDETRHLLFDGTISAREAVTAPGPPPLRIQGAGQLNDRAVHFDIDCDPLASADRRKPYGYRFAEQSSGSRITGSGSLPQPFDFRFIDATFAATGEDLVDLYHLTGVRLVNTGRYRLSGRVARRGARTEFTDLAGSSGQSDLRGTLLIESSGDRPMLHIDLASQMMRFADLGLRAAGREPQNSSARLLMSDAALNPEVLRRDDVVATLRAQRVQVGRFPIDDVAATLRIDHGILTLAPVTGRIFGGTLTAHATANVASDDPADSLDLKIADLELGRYVPQGKDQPLAEGLLRARVMAKGHGRSLHEFASNADGTLTVAVPSGTLRASLTALADLDLRAMGLVLDKKAPDKKVRCGVAGFEARGGILKAQSLVLDTDDVLITGGGTIRMDSEAIDLTLTGHPKRPRLRFQSPVMVHGTLSQPSFGIQPRNAGAQAAAAVALGVFLTPLASILAFVDPGLAKDADCADLVTRDKTPHGTGPAAPRTH